MGHGSWLHTGVSDWVGVLLYTDGITASANESSLFTFPIQYTGAPATLTQGDVLYANATPVLTSLPIAAAGAFLRSTGTLPAWSTATIPDTATAGDVLYASATNVWSALAKGTALQVLRMNAGATAPEWAAGGDLTAAGNETITGQWEFTNTSGTTFRHILKAASGSWDIGTTSNRWNNIYGTAIYADTLYPASDGSVTVTGGSDLMSLGAGDSLKIPSGYLAVNTAGAALKLNVSGGIMAYGGVMVCGSAILATTATDGFLYIPHCQGTPTGVPTSYTGTSPLVFDVTNDIIYVYHGSWIGTAALT